MGGPSSPSKKQILQSSGIVPQGYRILDKATLNKIYFSTSTADSFRPRPVAEALACQSESYKRIHQIDKEFGHRVSQAPPYQRSMCAYHQDYIPRPLNGVLINRELYKIHKENFAGSGGNVSGGSLSSDTTFRHFYPQHSAREMLTARPSPCKPAVDTHVDAEARLLFTESITHDHYPTPDTSTGLGRHEIHSRNKPKGASRMSRPTVKFPFQGATSYVRDYYDSDFEYVKETNIPLSANNVVKRSQAQGIADTYLGDFITYI